MELPPRARRIPLIAEYGGVDWGTTSACAENTNWWRSPAGLPWNYLRVRGEYTFGFEAIEFAEELPPRARRIHRVFLILGMSGGTTSACAENTTGNLISEVSATNYLRVRGEYNA